MVSRVSGLFFFWPWNSSCLHWSQVQAVVRWFEDVTAFPQAPNFPFSKDSARAGCMRTTKRALPKHAAFELRNTLSAFSLASCALTRADSCEQVVCGWQRLASHTNSGAANVSWAGRAPRAIYFFRWGYSLVQESASRKDRALFWARRRCLSRRERDEDDHCVMSSCVTVAVCSRSLSVSWIYLMYSAQVLLTCPFISYEKTLKRMNTALVSVKRQCTWYVA